MLLVQDPCIKHNIKHRKTIQNIPASLTHSVSSVLRAALSPFWMLRCLLVALRRSGCACCYGSVPTAPRRSCVQLAAGWVVVGFSIWHSSLHTFGIRLECSRPPMFLRTILVLQNNTKHTFRTSGSFPTPWSKPRRLETSKNGFFPLICCDFLKHLMKGSQHP
jgi:hypothetical protein